MTRPSLYCTITLQRNENIMPTVEEQCIELCGGRDMYHLSVAEQAIIGPQLSRCLLDANAVNTVWNCNSQYHTKDTIVSYLMYLDEDVIGQLLGKGLNLNLEVHHGVTQFTWIIGNAENEWANFLLQLSEKYQSREQRLTWINNTDSMIRATEKPLFHRLFSSEHYSFSHVKQTALQLAITKGYEGQTGSGNIVKISNRQLAEQLLALGADEGINYQEPTKGNTVLHIAYARRDLSAIRLLESYGASLDIVNHEEKKPSDMLNLTFNQTQDLLKFHTSPDHHPNTFLLDKTRFNNASNLLKIRLHASNPFDKTQKLSEDIQNPSV